MSFGSPPTLWCVLIFAAALDARRADLDHVGVGRALADEVDLAELVGLRLEDADEGLADALALRLRVGHLGEVARGSGRWHRRAARFIAMCSRKVSTTRSGSPWRSRPLSTKMQVELVADGAVHERGRDRRIDAARERADDLAVADALADAAIDSSMKFAAVQSPRQPRRRRGSCGSAARPGACGRPPGGTGIREVARVVRHRRRRATFRTARWSGIPAGAR